MEKNWIKTDDSAPHFTWPCGCRARYDHGKGGLDDWPPCPHHESQAFEAWEAKSREEGLFQAVWNFVVPPKVDARCDICGKSWDSPDGTVIAYPGDQPPFVSDCPHDFRGMIWGYARNTPENREKARAEHLQNWPDWVMDKAFREVGDE